MAKYLITGGCGFIGSHLVRSLIESGEEVRVLDDLSTGKKENLPESAELLVGCITEKKILERALKGIQGCFHLAAIASVEKSIHEWEKSHRVNMFGSRLLIETIDRNIPIVFASSAAVYGNPVTLPLKECSPTKPLSPYGVDKLAVEMHLENSSHMHSSLRFFNVYGSGQDPLSPYSGVISRFIEKMMHDEAITLFGDGTQVRDFIHISDVVRFLRIAMEKRTNGSFNIATGNGTSINQLVDILEKIMNKKVKKEYRERRKSDIAASIGDPFFAEKTFGIRAEMSLEEGLKGLIGEFV